MITIHPNFRHAFDGAVWRMEVDEDTHVLALEIRNEASKQVSFAAVDLSQGNLLFEGLVMNERWLYGMEAATRGALLLHGYESQSAPVHKGITAIDERSGTVLWGNYNLTFDVLTPDGPVLHDGLFTPPKCYTYDARTGKAITRVNISEVTAVESSIAVPDILLPDDYRVKHLLPAGAEGPVHYIGYNRFRIVSLHVRNGRVLNQRLYIFDADDLVFEDLLNADIQKLQPEAFVLHKNRLIYLKNKNELIVFAF